MGPFTACWCAPGVGKLCILRGVSPRGDHGHVVVARVTSDGEHLDANEPCKNPSRFCWQCFGQPLQSVAFHFQIDSANSSPCRKASHACSTTMSPLVAVSALGS